ncbi:hypothetical protein QTP88_000546 [Uroleucon formosanum]
MDNDNKMYTVFSLAMTAYRASNEPQQEKYRRLEVPDLDLRECCMLLFEIVDLNAESDDFDPLGDRTTVFAKVVRDDNERMERFNDQWVFMGRADVQNGSGQRPS